jgi:hypothetical protein
LRRMLQQHLDIGRLKVSTIRALGGNAIPALT